MTEPITNTVSTFIDSQLPQFIREDNPRFGAFLKAYYQWMETSNNSAIIGESKKLLSYKDIDRTTDAFIQYYINDFLPYFPNSTALDEKKLLKAARDFYQKKGSVESLQFLFRVLYNKEASIYFPKDNILKTSDGKWTQPQALRVVLDAETLNFDVNQLVGRFGVGSISNTYCVIESASKTVDSDLGITLIELIVSGVTQAFAQLENLNITYTTANGSSQLFSQKIIAALSDIKIDPNNRGTKYTGYVKDSGGNFTYLGDPVVITGGLASGDVQARKATAFVGNVTSGSITGVTVQYGGCGYRVFPNTISRVVNDPADNTGAGANVIVQAFDSTNSIFLLLNTDAITYKQNSTISAADYAFLNLAFSNANTPLQNAFSFANVQFAAITSMNVINGGGGYTAVPTLNLSTFYYSDYTTDTANTGNTALLANVLSYISELGYVCNVVIGSGGTGYSNVTDTIVVPSAIGYNATFTFQTTANVISSVTITNRGEGYIQLPINLIIANSTNVSNSSAGSNAVLTAYGFGQGAQFNIAVDKIGLISDFRITSRGFDYISTPNISLRIQDVIINTLPANTSFVVDTKLYQGASINAASYSAYIDSYNVTSGVLRLYDYQGALNVFANLVATTLNARVNISATGNVKTYGDGKAKATAIFLNGLIKFPGFYLNTDGMPSSDMYLQDSDKYHNYSYVIVVEKALSEYKNTLMQLIHPPGMDMLGQYSIIADENISLNAVSNISISTNAAGNIGVDGQYFSNTGNGNGWYSILNAGNTPLTTMKPLSNSTYWIRTAANTLIVNSPTGILAPDGSTSNVVRMTENTSPLAFYGLSHDWVGAENPVGQQVANANVTFSIYAKFGSSNGANQFLSIISDITGGNDNAAVTTFNTAASPMTFLANSNTGTQSRQRGWSITPVANSNGWHRLATTVTLGSNTQLRFGVSFATTSASLSYPTYAGNSSNMIYLWGPQLDTNTGNSITPNQYYGLHTMFGTQNSFGSVGNVGDMVVFNTTDSSRRLHTKTITGIGNGNIAYLDANTNFIFTNPANVTNTSNVIVSTNVLGNIAVNDLVQLNVNGNIQLSLVQVVAQNSLSVNTIFQVNVSNIMLSVFPSMNGASYTIVQAPK